MAQPEKVKKNSMQGLGLALYRMASIKSPGEAGVLIFCAGIFDSARQSLWPLPELLRVDHGMKADPVVYRRG
ncbi:hypothetical protein [Pseudomonas migulae]|uniref:Uncharacterized protein n=1 Tax=Pseudomonas migulae TaxID=78543 RepID=A0ABY8ML78_9PSED|nr:hypothetical protein [Pseudomonas migulae]WGK88097.1 hypothetical protein MOQ58_16270 [Pseudomonas migulae]